MGLLVLLLLNGAALSSTSSVSLVPGPAPVLLLSALVVALEPELELLLSALG